MNRSDASPLHDPRARTFEVICAGEAVVTLVERPAAQPDPGLRLRPGGGAVNAALSLARQGLRVGLATVLADTRGGRALRDEVAAAGVDVGGVELARSTGGLSFVRGGARQVVSARDEEQPIALPDGWSARVLLLSGMSPVLAHGAALCRTARRARREGAVVVVDVNAQWDQWRGRDARAVRMVLREADVVWCSAQDLFGLKMDLSALRAALRPTAVLVSSDGAGRASARGPFGEVTHVVRAATPRAALGEGSAFAAAVASELARAGRGTESEEAMWTRALRRGHAATVEQFSR